MVKGKISGNNKFVFIGTIGYGAEPLSVKKLSETSKWYKTRLNISVRNGNNSPFLTMEDIHEGIQPEEIRIMTNEKDDEGKTIYMKVPAADTTKEEIINKIPDFLKVTIDLETDFEKKKEYTSLIFKKRNHEIENNNLKSQETLSDAEKSKIADNEAKIKEYAAQIKELATNRVELLMKDAITFLNGALPTLKGLKVKVSGNIKSNYYNNKNVIQYIPNTIEIVPDETEDMLKAWFDMYYEKEGIIDDKKEKKVFANGYIGERVRGADKLYPISVVFDYAKYDLENETHKKIFELQKATFEAKSKKYVYKNRVEVNVVNGAEEKEFGIDCLSPLQRQQVELGLAKLESFKKGKVFGERVQELKLFKAALTDEFAEGCIEAFDIEELGDYLANDDSDKKVEEVIKEPEKKEEQNIDQLMKDLFN